MHVVTASEIRGVVEPIDSPITGMASGGVTAAVVAVLPGSHLNNAEDVRVEDLSVELQGLNTYAANLPGIFSLATEGLGLLSFDLVDAPMFGNGDPAGSVLVVSGASSQTRLSLGSIAVVSAYAAYLC